MSVWARSVAPYHLFTGRGFLRSIMLRRCVPSEWVRCSSNHDDNRGNLVISTATGINILNEIRADNPYSAPNIYPHHSEIVRGKWHNLDTLSVTMRRCDIDQRRRFRTCWIRYQRRYQFDATMIWWHESYWKVPKHSYSLDRQQISDSNIYIITSEYAVLRCMKVKGVRHFSLQRYMRVVKERVGKQTRHILTYLRL